MEEAFFAVSVDPVSIWTTCLKDEVSAWTKVVGYGFEDSDLVMGFGGYGAAGEEGGGGAVGDDAASWWSPLLLLLLLVELRGDGRRVVVAAGWWWWKWWLLVVLGDLEFESMVDCYREKERD